MKEPVVTIKLTLSELKTINNMFYSVKMLVDNYSGHKQDPSIKLLQTQLLKIEEDIHEEKRKSEIDKKINIESSQKVCEPCDD
tara:strand:+ start:2815 stop:3063 length:249 start_codon:yes stop_codon:yes gene_type:complete